jgi:EF-P beta-lysylation protein EpmB
MHQSIQVTQPIGPSEPRSKLTWQQELARAFRSIPELLRELELDSARMDISADVLNEFPLRVPRGFVSRMQKKNYDDPLLRQILPIVDEGRIVPGYTTDPVGDLASARGHGILQKYHGRALLMVTGACAIHCRYCFRRAYPYDEGTMPSRKIDSVIDRLSNDPSIEEVILSGGDPLSLTDQKLETLLSALDQITHLRRIRIHTRLPVVLPERIDPGLTRALSRTSKPLIVVLHCNHANEIDNGVSDAISRLSEQVFMLLNQAVLLRGVNDSPTALVALSERLFEVGVMPYYLHQLDPVQGAAHFKVDDKRALELVASAAKVLPGYLVPKLVREIPGAPAKAMITPDVKRN